MKHEDRDNTDLEGSLERYRRATNAPSTDGLRARLRAAGLPLQAAASFADSTSPVQAQSAALGDRASAATRTRAAGRLLPFALRLVGFAAIVLVAVCLGLRDFQAPKTLHAEALDQIVVVRNGQASTHGGAVYLCTGDVLRPAGERATLRCCKTGSEIRFGRRALVRFVRWQDDGVPLFDLSSGDLELLTRQASFDFEVQGTQFRCTDSECRLVRTCGCKDGEVKVTPKRSGVVMIGRPGVSPAATSCASHQSFSCGRCRGCGLGR